MKWLTQKGMTMQRLVCPWLITRFIDPSPKFFFVEESQIDAQINETGAIPFDIDGAELAESGPWTVLDKFLFVYRFSNPALDELAKKINPKNEVNFEKLLVEAGHPELVSVTMDLSHDDNIAMEAGLKIYDALFNWCKNQVLSKKVVPSININKVL